MILADHYSTGFWERRIRTPWRLVRRMPWRDILAPGEARVCNICGWQGAFFRGGEGTRDERWCPRCKSSNRHRLIAWFLETRRPDLLEPGVRFLHVAPERSLGTVFARVPGLDYRTCDLERRDVHHRIDLQRQIVDEECADIIMINHVLEHVPDDRAALRNLRRMLKPDGLCLITVPIRPGGLPTDEDPAVTDPDERRRRFGQRDHVRYYGRDLVERLAQVGFRAEAWSDADADAEAVSRHAMAGETLFLATRPG